jgi:hypothetical protein
MDKRTAGIIATVATVLLCGLPGLVGLCMGAMFALVSFIPGAQIDMFGSNDPRSAFNFGLGSLCVGILLVLTPVIVGFLTLRNRPALSAAAPPPDSSTPPDSSNPPSGPTPPDEPIPPAI